MDQQQQHESVECIFGDSLALFSGEHHAEIAAHEPPLLFGPLTLTAAPKANTLLADHIFSPAFLLAERIERGLIDLSNRSVVELGAGTALPSLLASTLPASPTLVVVTDYPDDLILSNLQTNVDRNSSSVTAPCTVQCRGYEWGKDPSNLLRLLSSRGLQSPSEGFDAVVLSDLLHFDRSHGALLDSVCTLLARHDRARVYVAAGVYTKSDVCTAFLHQAERRGLLWVDSGAGQDGREVDAVWRGALPVPGMDRDQLGARKGMCRWWVGRWSDEQLF
ncbi:hypothetical protein F5148DRAFT_1313640 [Russula earlei]|uniref:Uncharacterized protein n=1 Tax=Russula earlei TaxID=71964 RepID=A0ACC0U4H6_9AGAM|nr:hypothetical protein F5148DRAFT_1313640 [Russula earlei]